jgi:hypothetical protein
VKGLDDALLSGAGENTRLLVLMRRQLRKVNQFNPWKTNSTLVRM